MLGDTPNSLTLVALQYELALLVGQDLRLKPMLRRFFPPALKLLGCKSGHLWLQCDPSGLFEHRYAYPLRDTDRWQSNAAFVAAVSAYSTAAHVPALRPIDEDTYLHFIPLGALGFCLLVREGTPFDNRVVEALVPIFERLATACEACLDHEESESLRTVAATNELRLRTVVEAVEEVILQTDQAGQISFLNSAWTRITGFTIEDTLGTRLSQYFLPEDKARLEAGLLAVAVGTGSTQALEARLQACDGGRPWVSLQIASNRGATGFDESGLTCTIIDITEQRRMIDALVQARTTAEEANNAKSTFLANMSHEIRTPMNGVIGLAELVLESDLAPDVRTHLTMIRSSGEHLMTVINDILDYSKIEANRLDCVNEDLALHSLVEDTVATMRLHAQSKGLPIETQISAAVPLWVRGDAAKLRQILLNLLGNAIKFTHQGHVHLRVELKSETATDYTLIFSVADTGIGIAPDQQQAIFDAFTQADDSISRGYGGTGLGLAICQRLVMLMGGVLSVESQVNEGSTFSFTADFDRTMSINETERPMRAISSSPGVMAAQDGASPQTSFNILVVEDNGVNRQLMSYLLQKLGHTVTLASDGEAALQASAQETFDLVLMDMQMPVMDGLAAARAIRERELVNGDTPIPIHALTANAMPGDRERCLAAGMDGYLAKPLQRDELDRVLEDLGMQKQA